MYQIEIGLCSHRQNRRAEADILGDGHRYLSLIYRKPHRPLDRS